MTSRNLLGYIISGVFPIFELSCNFILVKTKSSLKFRKRGVKLIQVCSIAAWVSYINLLFSLFGGIYCGFYHIFIILLPPLSIGPQLIRGITLWGMLEHNKYMLEYGQTARLRKSVMHGGSKREGMDSQPSMTPILEGSSSRDEDFIESLQSEELDEKAKIRQRAVKVKKKMKNMVRLTKLVLVSQSLILALALLLLTSPKTLVSQKIEECFLEETLFVTISKACAFIYTIAAFIATILVRHCKDELGLRAEISRNVIILFLSNSFAIISGFVHSDHIWQTNIYAIQQMMLSFSMIIIPCFFPSLPNALLERIKIRSFQSLSVPARNTVIPNISGKNRSSMILPINSSQKGGSDTERESEMAMSLDAGLCVLLSTNEGIAAFTEHCSREFSVENIRFWTAVNEFHNAVDLLRTPACQDESDYGENDLRLFALDIVDSYIKNDSDMQINISASQRNKIQRDLKNTSGPIKRGIFDSAQKEVYAMMSRHSYPRFLVSNKSNASKVSNSTKRSTAITPDGIV